MAADAINRINPVPIRADGWRLGGYPGDLPETIKARYYTETRLLAPLAFYKDAVTRRPAFRDHGGRLSTERNDPDVVRDLVAIARHRAWTSIAVRGQPGFRREVWITARVEGLEVRGYRPTERDLQDLARRRDRRGERAPAAVSPPATRRSRDPVPAPETRLRIVETVVRARIADPAAQARILEGARARLAGWLERGARLRPVEVPRRDRTR